MKNKLILIIGLGTITKGIVKNLIRGNFKNIKIYSAHYNHPQYLGVPIINRLDDLNASILNAAVILFCFHDDIMAEKFLKSIDLSCLKNSIIIDMTTSKIHSIISRKNIVEINNANYIECPFTGSREGSENGSLVLFIYKEKLNENNERLLRLFFDCISAKQYLFSYSGNPTKFKLIYNFWGATILVSLKYFNPEKFNFNREDLDLVKKIFSNTGWMSKVVSSKLEYICRDDFEDIHFKAELMLKDLTYAIDEIDVLEGEYYVSVLEEYKKIEDKSKDYTIVAKL